MILNMRKMEVEKNILHMFRIMSMIFFIWRCLFSLLQVRGFNAVWLFQKDV